MGDTSPRNTLPGRDSGFGVVLVGATTAPTETDEYEVPASGVLSPSRERGLSGCCLCVLGPICGLALFLRKERVHQDCLDGSAVLVKSFARVVVFDNAYDAPEP